MLSPPRHRPRGSCCLRSTTKVPGPAMTVLPGTQAPPWEHALACRACLFIFYRHVCGKTCLHPTISCCRRRWARPRMRLTSATPGMRVLWKRTDVRPGIEHSSFRASNIIVDTSMSPKNANNGQLTPQDPDIAGNSTRAKGRLILWVGALLFPAKSGEPPP